MAISIESDTPIPVDNSFKISAGPGAGKTHWLSLHVLRVISSSKKLGITRRIACISYTNVGVDTLNERLPSSSNCVEICTIHSFLYNHVVKPFIHFEAKNWGINEESIRMVATESFLTKAFAQIVSDKCHCSWIDTKCIQDGIQKSHWMYRNGIFVGFKPKYPIVAYDKSGRITKYKVPQKVYDTYNSIRWENGYISYDDVIFLGMELLHKHPDIFNIIVAKFPYFFIDEFQDSISPIVDFIKELGNRGVTIGVVGDKAQTIYDFIGASVEMFDNFYIPGITEYEIHGNRRSSPQIINLLNYLRPDFPQKPINAEDGKIPLLLVGNKLDAYTEAMKICQSDNVQSLAFPNIIANTMKLGFTDDLPNENLIDSDFDANFTRATYMRHLLKATEYAHDNDLREAWHQLDLLNDERIITIGYLQMLLKYRPNLLNGTFYDFYLYVIRSIGIHLSTLRNGTIKNFYQEHSYKEMALCIKVSDKKSIHKTIHKAKGEEFDNVLIVLDRLENLSALLKPQLNSNSTHRVFYVGMSRARQNLFINIETISESQEEKLKHLPLTILYV